jgi:hypothetical protein
VGEVLALLVRAAHVGVTNQRLRGMEKRPGRAFEPCGLPDLPGLNFIWPDRTQTARHGTTTCTLHPGTLRK